MAVEPILAVDFGTTSSSAALVVGGEILPVKEPASGSWSWPSSVFLDGGTLQVGTLAERRKRVRPELYRAEFKRDLGLDVPLVFGDKSFSTESLVAVVLRTLKEEAERLHGGPVGRAVITVPASYGMNDSRRATMLRAATSAGFEVAELLPEPVAAALAPVTGTPFAPGDVVLVYDFGGGTFDAAVIRVGEGGHEVLGHAALDHVGGRDVDALVYGEVRGRLGTHLGDGESPRVRLELGDFSRQLKHQLSDAQRAEDVFASSDAHVELERAWLSDAVTPLLAQTVDCCEQLLGSCGLTSEDVASVVLVGGTTRMPIVSMYLRHVLARPIRQVTDPELAVTQGAARWALAMGGRVLKSVSLPAGTEILGWDVPGGAGTLVRWFVAPGEQFDQSSVLGQVRLADGGIWDLAAGTSGTVVHHLAAPGALVVTGEPIVTAYTADAAPAAAHWTVLVPPDLPEDLARAINHPVPAVRENAVRRLAELIVGEDRTREASARAVLTTMRDDDSRRVATAATLALTPGSPLDLYLPEAVADRVAKARSTLSPRSPRAKGITRPNPAKGVSQPVTVYGRWLTVVNSTLAGAAIGLVAALFFGVLNHGKTGDAMVLIVPGGLVGAAYGFLRARKGVSSRLRVPGRWVTVARFALLGLAAGTVVGFVTRGVFGISGQLLIILGASAGAVYGFLRAGARGGPRHPH